MSLIESIFGKNLKDINLTDFTEFFLEEKEETQNLEFKSGDVEIEDIYKEAAAFLNTEGGILIIGSPKETKKMINQNTVKRICKGKPIPSKFRDKGWLQQKLSTNIVPFAPGINIHEILTSEGNHFILEIAQSGSAPHQCNNDGKYYIRIDDQARPAPHGIIKALFQKRQKPFLTSNIMISSEKEGDIKNEIVISIKNTSEYPAENVSFLVQLYNIKEIITEKYHKNSYDFREGDNEFYLQKSLDQLIIQDIVIPIEFDLIHKMQPYMLLLLVWDKEYGVHKNYFIYDPIKNNFIKTYKTGDDEIPTNQDFFDVFSELIK